MLLCKMVAMVILHQFLSAGHIMSNVTKHDDLLTFDLSIVGMIEKLEKCLFHLKFQGLCC